jgi:hypothetical protein
MLPAESGSQPLRLYMTAWDHNGVGRVKPLGKPDKTRALLEQVWWNTLGKLSCTCHRGRLTEDAPCVHKLTMAALSDTWLREANLPTAHELKQGVRVGRVGLDEAGGYFAVLDNPHGALSPQRRMLFRSRGSAWHCEGKNDGCPAITDCSHVSAAKVAPSKGDIPTADVLQPSLEALAKAACWLEQWDGILPEIGAPIVGHVESRSNVGDGAGGLTSEQRYLMGLLMSQPHEGATCAGSSCFCRKHASLFEEARPPSEGSPEAMEKGDEPSTSGALAELPPRKRARRSKAFWEEEKRTTSTVHNVRSERPTPHANDACGKDAIRGWVPACSSCTLSSVRMGGCSHGIEERVECPVMLLGTEAVQLTKPKLGRLSDATNFHDPWVTSLGSPVRVSKLRDCHFKELSDRGLLSAPCPLGAPPCGGQWVEAWVEASVTASQWSQRVRARIYHCTCFDEAHTVHFDGEHLGLYTWNRRTLFVQESLQLILRGMQKGHSFKAELATNQAAFERSPGAEVLNEETWRKASFDFFKLVGLRMRDCCTLCGLIPR